MPDFNKGDFTQQGVNGHVNATVRLNEKRLVNIDMTSNEEAEGCTITGTVTDLLNDKVYNIGSGGGTLATVEFEENGTYSPADYEAYGFGEVTVNVAGGFPYCTVHLHNDGIAASPPYENPMYNAETGIFDLVQVPGQQTVDVLSFYFMWDDYPDRVFITDCIQSDVIQPCSIVSADITDAVNLEAIPSSDDPGVYYIAVIDPTKPSSYTAVVPGGD